MKILYKEYFKKHSYGLISMDNTVREALDLIKPYVIRNSKTNAYNTFYLRKSIKHLTYSQACKYYKTDYCLRIKDSYFYTIFRGNLKYCLRKKIKNESNI